MATRLGGLARRIAAARALLPTRGGGGGPVALTKAPTQPLGEENELIWDDGTANPEYCLDRDNMTSQAGGLAFLAAGLSTFLVVGMAARIYNKPAKQPFAPRQYPYDNLKEERGGYNY